MEDHSSDAAEQDSTAHVQQMQAQLRVFWKRQMEEMQALEVCTPSGMCKDDFKNHNDLPLARIKRIMKSDEDVRMISAEAPVLFAKACEMFILELTLRAWCYSEKNKRRTLQKEDIQTAIRRTEIFDFLACTVDCNPFNGGSSHSPTAGPSSMPTSSSAGPMPPSTMPTAMSLPLSAIPAPVPPISSTAAAAPPSGSQPVASQRLQHTMQY